MKIKPIKSSAKTVSPLDRAAQHKFNVEMNLTELAILHQILEYTQDVNEESSSDDLQNRNALSKIGLAMFDKIDDLFYELDSSAGDDLEGVRAFTGYIDLNEGVIQY